MTNGVLRSRPPSPPGFLRRFVAARRAGAAVEFALLAPLAALGICGLASPRPAPSVEKPAVTSTIGDRAAQSALEAAQAR